MCQHINVYGCGGVHVSVMDEILLSMCICTTCTFWLFVCLCECVWYLCTMLIHMSSVQTHRSAYTNLQTIIFLQL